MTAALELFASKMYPDPLDDAKGMSQADFQAKHFSEGALIPNPYFEDPEPLFGWNVDAALKEVSVESRDASVKVRADVVIGVLGLNREELCRLRYKTYLMLEGNVQPVLSGALQGGPLMDQLFLIERLADSEFPFAGMIRYFVYDLWMVLPRP